MQKGVLQKMDKLWQGIREDLVETRKAKKRREERKVECVPLLLRIRKGNTSAYVATSETVRPETIDSDELYALRVANGLRPPPSQDSTNPYERQQSFNRMESQEVDGMQGMKGESHVDSDETSFFRDDVVKCFEISQPTTEMLTPRTVLESSSEIDSLQLRTYDFKPRRARNARGKRDIQTGRFIRKQHNTRSAPKVRRNPRISSLASRTPFTRSQASRGAKGRRRPTG